MATDYADKNPRICMTMMRGWEQAEIRFYLQQNLSPQDAIPDFQTFTIDACFHIDICAKSCLTGLIRVNDLERKQF